MDNILLILGEMEANSDAEMHLELETPTKKRSSPSGATTQKKKRKNKTEEPKEVCDQSPEMLNSSMKENKKKRKSDCDQVDSPAREEPQETKKQKQRKRVSKRQTAEEEQEETPITGPNIDSLPDEMVSYSLSCVLLSFLCCLSQLTLAALRDPFLSAFPRTSQRCACVPSLAVPSLSLRLS